MNPLFDQVPSRRGTHSYKWDETDDADVLPLWVADMDFPTAPVVREALERRVRHGIFGYAMVPEAYFEATQAWFREHHGWQMQREWMLYTSGVVPAISCIVRALALPADKVLLSTPTFNCFFSSVRNQGCLVAESPFVVQDGKYVFDFDDFERQCADERTVAYILCNPQNPGGRVWTREELRRVADICHRHHVTVIADEIHNELTLPGHTYVPFASVSPEAAQVAVTCISPSKSFNTAGLQIATIVTADADLRRRIDRVINIHEVCDVNPFGIEATIAAYSPRGHEWLCQLRAYLADNAALLQQFFATLNTAGHPLYSMPLEGTYLAWIDCRELLRRRGLTSDQLASRLLSEAKVCFNSGATYGAAGEGYLRINMACPRATLIEALERLRRWLEA